MTTKSSPPIAFITGVNGQDGALLAEFLLNKGYAVHGIKRRSSTFNTERIDHLIHHTRFSFYHSDIIDSLSLTNLISQIQPDEIYNLAAQSHIKVSFEVPEYTANTDALGVLRILEIIKTLGLQNKTRFYQASTSEIFGNAKAPQNENTPFQPCSPYGTAKLFGHWITVNYREAYNMHASSGILFNHESSIRGKTFVTRKITRTVAKIANGIDTVLCLGELNAKRDWGHACDYVEAMWLMLQQNQPDDYVIATGETHSVREFAELAFAEIGVQLHWETRDELERGVGPDGRVYIQQDPRYYRPSEIYRLEGDASKAQRVLGWRPRTNFRELIKKMVAADIKSFQ